MSSFIRNKTARDNEEKELSGAYFDVRTPTSPTEFQTISTGCGIESEFEYSSKKEEPRSNRREFLEQEEAGESSHIEPQSFKMAAGGNSCHPSESVTLALVEQIRLTFENHRSFNTDVMQQMMQKLTRQDERLIKLEYESKITTEQVRELQDTVEYHETEIKMNASVGSKQAKMIQKQQQSTEENTEKIKQHDKQLQNIERALTTSSVGSSNESFDRESVVDSLVKPSEGAPGEQLAEKRKVNETLQEGLKEEAVEGAVGGQPLASQVDTVAALLEVFTQQIQQMTLSSPDKNEILKMLKEVKEQQGKDLLVVEQLSLPTQECQSEVENQELV